MVTRASGFTLQNGAIVHIGEQSGLQLNQTTNAVIDNNRFATDGTGDAVFAYGPTANIRITNNPGWDRSMWILAEMQMAPVMEWFLREMRCSR